MMYLENTGWVTAMRWNLIIVFLYIWISSAVAFLHKLGQRQAAPTYLSGGYVFILDLSTLGYELVNRLILVSSDATLPI